MAMKKERLPKHRMVLRSLPRPAFGCVYSQPSQAHQKLARHHCVHVTYPHSSEKAPYPHTVREEQVVFLPIVNAALTSAWDD